MIISRVKVKDQETKCTLTFPPFTGSIINQVHHYISQFAYSNSCCKFINFRTGKSGRYAEDNPFAVKGRKRASVGEPTANGGLYFSVDLPGACGDDIEVLADENEVRFYAEIKHDESGRIYLGSIKRPSPGSFSFQPQHGLGCRVWCSQYCCCTSSNDPHQQQLQRLSLINHSISIVFLLEQLWHV